MHNCQRVQLGRKQNRELRERLGDVTVKEEVWTALQQLERGSKDVVNVGAEAAKLAKEACPQQDDTANKQAIEAFVCAVDPKLALEVQKLDHCMLDDVIAAA